MERPDVFYLEKKYELCCQGILQPEASETRELKCRYETNNVPYFLIGPFKLEEVSKDPIIVLYHDAMYDNEIDHLKLVGRLTLRRSEVNNMDGDGAKVDYFICKSNVLHDNDPYVNRIFWRVEDMTGLDMIASESLQILNYGVGGYYAPHLDSAQVSHMVHFVFTLSRSSCGLHHLVFFYSHL